MSLAPASLTESALRRLEDCNTKLVRWGPLAQLEKIIPQNRLVVMTALLFIYNQQISCLQKSSLDQLCKVVCKWVVPIEIARYWLPLLCRSVLYTILTDDIDKFMLSVLCFSRLVTQGFNKPGKRVSYSTDVPRVLPRIPVSPKLLLEILQSLYFSV